MDIQICSVLCNISVLEEHPLKDIGLHQLSTVSTKSRSWFLYASIRLEKYNIDVLDILLGNLDKHETKHRIVTKWFQDLSTEALSKTSLRLLDVDTCRPGKCHPVWAAVTCNKAETRQAIIKAKLLTGTYMLQSTRSKYNQYEVDPTCKLCGEEPEDLAHFLLSCPTLNITRLKHLGPITIHIPQLSNLCPETQIQTLLDPPTSLNFLETSRPVVEKLVNGFLYSMHCKRLLLLNQCS